MLEAFHAAEAAHHDYTLAELVHERNNLLHDLNPEFRHAEVGHFVDHEPVYHGEYHGDSEYHGVDHYAHGDYGYEHELHREIEAHHSWPVDAHYAAHAEGHEFSHHANNPGPPYYPDLAQAKAAVDSTNKLRIQNGLKPLEWTFDLY